MTKHLETCVSCAENKCEVRKECPDDEITTEKRKLILLNIPEVIN